MRIEHLAVPVLEAFDKGGLAFGNKVGNLAVGECLFALAAEDGKPAIDVAALGDLRIKEDASGLAFGARDVFTVRHGHLYLQEFLGDLCGIDLDTLAEGCRIHFARFDTGKGGFPLPGHFNVGNLLALDGAVHGKPFLGRDKVLLLPAHVIT